MAQDYSPRAMHQCIVEIEAAARHQRSLTDVEALNFIEQLMAKKRSVEQSTGTRITMSNMLWLMNTNLYNCISSVMADRLSIVSPPSGSVGMLVGNPVVTNDIQNFYDIDLISSPPFLQKKHNGIFGVTETQRKTAIIEQSHLAAKVAYNKLPSDKKMHSPTGDVIAWEQLPDSTTEVLSDMAGIAGAQIALAYLDNAMTTMMNKIDEAGNCNQVRDTINTAMKKTIEEGNSDAYDMKELHDYQGGIKTWLWLRNSK